MLTAVIAVVTAAMTDVMAATVVAVIAVAVTDSMQWQQ